jgi:UDP-glucose 4-epimerase
MALCLVTGDPGLAGLPLVEALVAQGHDVRVLDHSGTKGAADLGALANVEIMTGSLTDLNTARAATAGVEVVFHQTGQLPSGERTSDPEAIHNICATSTLLLLLAARDAGVRRFIYASGACVYGASGKLPRREEDPTRPVSPYGVAQLAGEQYCKVFSQLYGLETVRLRYFSVFGPQEPNEGRDVGVVPCFLQHLLAGRSPVIHGDGLQSRDFTFVSDVVQANLLAAQARRVSGKVYNIAFGRQTTLLELLDCMNELLGSAIKPIHDQPRLGDVRHSVADTSLAQTELGFCPGTDLKDGLRKCIKLYTEWRARRGASWEVPLTPHMKLFGRKSTQVHLEL